MATPERPPHPAAATPALVPRGAVKVAERAALERGAGVVRFTDLERFRLTGAGRLACLQGLVTCDVERPGDDAYLFGALLTSRGMIVSTLWIARRPDHLLAVAPAAAAAEIAAVFERSLPPRLCRWEAATGATVSAGLYGPRAAELLAEVVEGALPDASGRLSRVSFDGAELLAARVAARGVEGFDLVLAAETVEPFLERLAASGATAIPDALLEERRILAGHPRLGAEIDAKTLPQEVRLDVLGAVSYTKGCYLGQETVARVHFRGHANRQLVGVELEVPPAELPADLLDDGRPVGRVTSACWWESAARFVGLAVVRRDLAPGDTARTADGAAVTVRALPWEPPRPATP